MCRIDPSEPHRFGMLLKDYDLRQIDDATLRSLGEEDLRTLSTKLLQDLKEARERLNQSPENSSRPPSSRAPWEKGDGSEESEAEHPSVLLFSTIRNLFVVVMRPLCYPCKILFEATIGAVERCEYPH